MYYTTYSSPIGKLLIVSDGNAIYKVSFNYTNVSKSKNFVQNEELDIFKDIKHYFDDYFAGKNPDMNFKLIPQGSKFRQNVWKIISKIPYGEITTYGDIASEISPTMSAQAVGGAVGANPIAILIPCHRVLGKNNKLTGYAAGLNKKIMLLEIENFLNYSL